jgi:alpha-1,3-glucan synthase
MPGLCTIFKSTARSDVPYAEVGRGSGVLFSLHRLTDRTDSEWFNYTERNVSLIPQPWSGTKLQEWTGDHVILHYWSAMTGSSDHVQHADLNDYDFWPRRWPHVFIEGGWNQYGYDSGLANQMNLGSNGFWEFRWMADWPTQVIVNVWGMNPDGAPDKSAAFGDVDGDGVLDWLPPDSLAQNVINFTNVPAGGYLGFELFVNDADLRYYVKPTGSAIIQIVVAVVVGLVPIITGILGIHIFQGAFYGVKFNEIGLSEKSNTFLAVVQQSGLYWTALEDLARGPKKRAKINTGADFGVTEIAVASENTLTASPLPNGLSEYINAWLPRRRTVLIATLEYEIEDWKIKVKIGGLGVMVRLTPEALQNSALLWRIPPSQSH